MKRLMMFAAVVALAGGCVVTTVKSPLVSGTRIAFAYPFKMGPVEVVSTNSVVKFGGYETDGGQQLLEGAVAAAFKAGMKAGSGALK